MVDSFLPFSATFHSTGAALVRGCQGEGEGLLLLSTGGLEGALTESDSLHTCKVGSPFLNLKYFLTCMMRMNCAGRYVAIKL